MSDQGESQMDANKGYDTPDAGGYMPSESGVPRRITSSQKTVSTNVITSSPISDTEFNASEYKVCPKIGKAVIVSNYMDDYNPRKNYRPKDPDCREYAKTDCENLEKVLRGLGFEPLNDSEMVHKNLTKEEFTKLYKKAAQEEDYRSQNGGYTCVLFIVMSYGRSGLIKCHAEKPDGKNQYAEQKDLQEAFQPQNNHSLALKPKIFIVQTIPEETDVADTTGKEEIRTTKRIPREADFLTYSSDSYCLKSTDGDSRNNLFIQTIVKILTELQQEKKESKPATEIQRLLIRMNNNFKKGRRDDWKIPCVTSSLTKQLKLF